jgi:hypothetical protein
MKKIKPPKRRSTAAKALERPEHRQRVVPSKKTLYKRSTRHAERHGHIMTSSSYFSE